jgi:hypothetical protein
MVLLVKYVLEKLLLDILEEQLRREFPRWSLTVKDSGILPYISILMDRFVEAAIDGAAGKSILISFADNHLHLTLSAHTCDHTQSMDTFSIRYNDPCLFDILSTTLENWYQQKITPEDVRWVYENNQK